MTDWAWALILVLAAVICWLSLALAEARAELRSYRRHVNRLLRETGDDYQAARLGSLERQRQRRLMGGGDAS